MKNSVIFILMILCFACNVYAQTDESLVIGQTAQIIAVDPQEMLLLQDATQGVFFFDSFGTYEKNLTLTSEQPMQWLNNKLLYLKDNQLHSYNHQTLEAGIIANMPEKLKQALIYRDKLILLNEKNVSIIQDFSVNLQK